MRIPTQQAFIAAFGADNGTAAYRLAKRLDDCREHPAVVKWAEQCHHDPRNSSQAYGECLMLALDTVIGGYGVEAIRGRYVDAYSHDVQATYVNMGDTYATTVLLDNETDRLQITSYGDWVEANERKREIV